MRDNTPRYKGEKTGRMYEKDAKRPTGVEKRTAKKPANRTIKQTEKKTTNRSTEWTNKQPAERTNKQSAKPMTKRTAERVTKQSAERVTKQSAEWMTKQSAERVTKQSAERTNKQFTERANKKFAERTNKQSAGRTIKQSEKQTLSPKDRATLEQDDQQRLEGRNAVLEALNHDVAIDKIFIKRGQPEGTLRVITAKARERGIVIIEADRAKLDAMSESDSHQGVIALCPVTEYVDIEDILGAAKEKGEAPFIIVLDGVTDPHNLGAVIRTAEACGAHGVVIPKRRSASLTGVVSKTSAGAISHMPVCRVTNVARLLEDLKSAGVWIACGDVSGEDLFEADLSGSVALVVGGEGGGVSRLVRDNCDFIVKIPMYGRISSLNVSVAAGVLMYEVVRKRKFC